MLYPLCCYSQCIQKFILFGFMLLNCYCDYFVYLNEVTSNTDFVIRAPIINKLLSFHGSSCQVIGIIVLFSFLNILLVFVVMLHVH